MEQGSGCVSFPVDDHHSDAGMKDFMPAQAYTPLCIRKWDLSSPYLSHDDKRRMDQIIKSCPC